MKDNSGPFDDKPPRGQELRKHKRLPYTTHHCIAPYRGGPVPTDDLFYPVTCHDISQAGFSFVSNRVPELSTFVLSMQVSGEPVYVSARMMNHRKTPDGNYVVGCKFMGKLMPAT